MSLIFIPSNYETFTPTQSGALATVIYELCRVAQRQNILPWVVAQGCATMPYDWPQKILLPYPEIPDAGAKYWAARAERRFLGWTHAGQRAFAHSMVREIEKRELQNLPFVLLNNPEIAILLRHKFPRARIFHWFANQLEVKPRIKNQLPRAIDGAFGVSDFTSRWIEQSFGFAPNSLLTLYNAADTNHFAPAATSSTRNAPVINFVGRLGIEKAPDVLLRAALLLSERTKNFALQMVGSNYWDHFELDDYQRELRSLTGQLQERGIEVRWTGHVARANLPEVLQRADINVMASRWDEPFGMATIEGMACGLATVASATGGTPEVVGDAALLFARDSAEELAAQLFRFVSDKDLRIEYSKRARQRALQFSWEKTWNDLQQNLDAA